MMTVRVRCAFFTPGSRKAFTPLLTASTPVSAVHPLAKTFSKSQNVTASVMAGGGGGGGKGRGGPPPKGNRAISPTMGESSVATKKKVRNIKNDPASRTPPRIQM